MRYRPRRELTRALRKSDLIQVVAGGPALAFAALGAGRPVVLQVATTVRWEREARRGGMALGPRLWRDAMTAWTARIEGSALAGVETVFVENDRMLDFVRTTGQREVVLAPPGVDTDRFRPSASGWSADGYLLSVCRLSEPRKRLDRLVAAYAELLGLMSRAPALVLAGCGPVPDVLREQIQRCGVAERITVRENIPDAELPALYKGASVYVQTSQEEGLGISVLESMASGVPVVATETAGARTCLAGGGCGALVPQTEERQLVHALARSIAAVLEEGESMSHRAREVCEEAFSSSVAVRRFADCYQRLLARA